jgi:membrane associated rhomboid family serine protease
VSRRDLINGWIAITLGVSILAWLDGGFAVTWLALAPARIWRGEIWRCATWIFVETSPMSLVFTCAAIYKFGGELAPRWGTRRLVRYVTELVLAAAIATALVALVSTRAYDSVRCGGWVIGDLLVIAWARQYPTSPLTLYGALTLHGRALVRVTVGVTVLYALAFYPAYLVPELVAVFAAACYPASRLARR